MRLLTPRHACLAALFGLVGVWVAWAGFGVETGGDDPVEFAPAFHALLGGHLGAFLAHLPKEGAGGSVLLRWPGAALGWALSPERITVFRFGALECVLALGLLGVVVSRRLTRSGPVRPGLRRIALVGLCLLAPAALGAISMGHPEEALGAALCIAAVLLAGADRAALAGLALGLAVINKPWGLLAVAPTLWALPHGRRRCALIAGGIAAAWLAAVYLGAPARFGSALAGLHAPPWPGDVWWPLTRVRISPGGIAYRALPAPAADYGRYVAAVLALGPALALFRRRPVTADCLAVLALGFLIRCAGDPSNLLYYELPFVVALGAWEAWRGRFPLLALLAAAGAWLALDGLAGAGPTAQFLAYLAVSAPFAAILGRAAVRGSPRVSSGRDGVPFLTGHPATRLV